MNQGVCLTIVVGLLAYTGVLKRHLRDHLSGSSRRVVLVELWALIAIDLALLLTGLMILPRVLTPNTLPAWLTFRESTASTAFACSCASLALLHVGHLIWVELSKLLDRPPLAAAGCLVVIGLSTWGAGLVVSFDPGLTIMIGMVIAVAVLAVATKR